MTRTFALGAALALALGTAAHAATLTGSSMSDAAPAPSYGPGWVNLNTGTYGSYVAYPERHTYPGYTVYPGYATAPVVTDYPSGYPQGYPYHRVDLFPQRHVDYPLGFESEDGKRGR